MNTVTIPRRARSVQGLLKRARRENAMPRSPEGAEFILAEADDFNCETEPARQYRALIKFLEACARQTEAASSQQGKTLFGLTK